MVKVSSMFDPVGQQLCYAHALQLAIIDVLYKKPAEEEEETGEESVNSASESEDEQPIEGGEADQEPDEFDDLLFAAFNQKEAEVMIRSIIVCFDSKLIEK